MDHLYRVTFLDKKYYLLTRDVNQEYNLKMFRTRGACLVFFYNILMTALMKHFLQPTDIKIYRFRQHKKERLSLIVAKILIRVCKLTEGDCATGFI